MTSRILIDTNVFIYSVGSEHPLRDPSIDILRLVAESANLFFTNAEVFQEMLHRYVSLRRWQTARIWVADFLELMAGRIEFVNEDDVRQAVALADDHPNIEARDLLHVAVM